VYLLGVGNSKELNRNEQKDMGQIYDL